MTLCKETSELEGYNANNVFRKKIISITFIIRQTDRDHIVQNKETIVMQDMLVYVHTRDSRRQCEWKQLCETYMSYARTIEWKRLQG